MLGGVDGNRNDPPKSQTTYDNHVDPYYGTYGGLVPDVPFFSRVFPVFHRFWAFFVP